MTSSILPEVCWVPTESLNLHQVCLIKKICQTNQIWFQLLQGRHRHRDAHICLRAEERVARSILIKWACQHLKSQELEQECFFLICPHQHLKTLPGWESCPCQCFQTSLPLSTSSNQSGRAACQLRSLGWRCRPENMAMKCI